MGPINGCTLSIPTPAELADTNVSSGLVTLFKYQSITYSSILQVVDVKASIDNAPTTGMLFKVNPQSPQIPS